MMDASSKAYDIAWHFVSTAYGLCEDDLVAQAYLAAHILRQHRRGERRAIALANRAISAYAKCANPDAGVARAVAISWASS